MFVFSDNTQLGILMLVKTVQGILIPCECGRPFRFISSHGLWGIKILKTLDLSSLKSQFSLKKGSNLLEKAQKVNFLPYWITWSRYLKTEWPCSWSLWPWELCRHHCCPRCRCLTSVVCLPAAGCCRRPLRRAINTKDELLEGSHVLVALGSSVRSFVTFVLLKVRIIQAMKMMLLCWYQTRLKRGVSISVMAVIPSTYRLVRYAHFLSQTSSLMLMWPGPQHRDAPPCLAACRRRALNRCTKASFIPCRSSHMVLSCCIMRYNDVAQWELSFRDAMRYVCRQRFKCCSSCIVLYLQIYRLSKSSSSR